MIVGVMAVGLLALVNVCVSCGDSKLGGLFGEKIGDVLKATEIETQKDGLIRIKKPIAEIPGFSSPFYEVKLSKGRLKSLRFTAILHDSEDKEAAVKLIREVKKRYGEPSIKDGDDFFSNAKELICKDGADGIVSYWRNGVYFTVGLSIGCLLIECQDDEDAVCYFGKKLAKAKSSEPEAYSKVRDKIERLVDAATFKRILKAEADVENVSSGNYL